MPWVKVHEKGIPVFIKTEEGFAFIEDFRMSPEANKQFEKEAPAGLYRGGAVIKVTCTHGVCVVPDERQNWLKPFAGIADFSEGHDLTLTGARELMEEAFVYDTKKTTRFVPKGKADGAAKACTLDFTVEKVVEVGEIVVLGHEINESNRAYEAVLGWDISGIDVLFSISLEESWWAGGHNGISVYAIDNAGALVGVFSGQQGFIEIPKYGIHPTLKKYL